MITQLKRLLPTPGVTGRGCLAWSRTRFSWQRLALKSAVSAEVCRSCRHFWINSFTTRCWKWVLQTVRYQHSAGWSCRAYVCVTHSLSLSQLPTPKQQSKHSGKPGHSDQPLYRNARRSIASTLCWHLRASVPRMDGGKNCTFGKTGRFTECGEIAAF